MRGIKVYVTTKSRPFHEEMFLDVHASKKDAIKSLFNEFPYMRKACKGSDDVWASDKDNTFLLFIHEKEI